MRCEEWKAQLEAYLDAELPPEQTTAFAGHMLDCSECGQRLAERRTFRERVKEELDFRAPTGLKEQILSAARAADRQDTRAGTRSASLAQRLFRWLGGEMRWPAIAGAIGLLLVMVFQLNPKNPAPSTFSSPGHVVILRYGETIGGAQNAELEMGGLILGSPKEETR